MDNNINQCSVEGEWVEYYKTAEPHMDSQWENVIFPKIKYADFEICIDLACGGGRNTAKLAPLCEKIYAIDLNQYAIDSAKKYLKEKLSEKDFSKITFIKNDGNELRELKDNSISFIYSFDAAVHMSKYIIKDYVKEFKRVLREKGGGFIHHSNFGAKEFSHIKDKSIIKNNPQWRADMSAEDFKDFCEEFGLDCTRQDISDWTTKNIDCYSMFHNSKN